MEQKILLNAKNVSVKIGATQLVSSIDLKVAEQSIVALLGPNGAGKTTLMHALTGLTRIEKTTTISFDNEVITHWRPDQRVAAGLIFLPQHSALFKQLSVADNLAIVYDYHTYWQQRPRSDFDRMCEEYLEVTGLSAITQRQAGVLSGGQKRKLELVRALLMQPRLIICDEPFAGVDPKSMYELRDLFAHVCKEKNISVLISDHNVEQLMEISSYLYMVLDGTIVTHGTLQDIMRDPVTRKRYFGSAFSETIRKRFLP